MTEEQVVEQEETTEQNDRPEPPKDENGRPCPPPHGPHGPRPPHGKKPDGERPEPPKDENGNPCPPPYKPEGNTTEEGRKILEEVMAYSRHDLLFSDYDGNPFTPSFLSQYFYRVSRYAGVKVYPLLMRKSFSADMYANSVNPAVIRSLMGHKSEDMSLNAYATAALSDVITASLKRKYKK